MSREQPSGRGQHWDLLPAASDDDLEAMRIFADRLAAAGVPTATVEPGGDLRGLIDEVFVVADGRDP